MSICTKRFAQFAAFSLGLRGSQRSAIQHASWLGVALLMLTACGHADVAKRPSPQPSASPSRAPAATHTPVPTEPIATEQIEDFMSDHFVIATYCRDAVINASLESLREPLQVLAAYDYATVAPGGWMSFVAQLQVAASLTAQAERLDQAAAGVATMARICGACHVAMARGPDFGPSEREAVAPKSDTLQVRMYRHAWAAERLWEGLAGPSDDAWQAGASALAHAPVAAPESDPPLTPEFEQALREVRELGIAAGEASSPADRANTYASFLASCAGCHAQEAAIRF